jgi:hypothetical protein
MQEVTKAPIRTIIAMTPACRGTMDTMQHVKSPRAKMKTIEQAESEGFTIDHHAAGRPLAYKGARFQPTEFVACFTPLEASLLGRIDRIIESASVTVAGAVLEPSQGITTGSELMFQLQDAKTVVRALRSGAGIERSALCP